MPDDSAFTPLQKYLSEIPAITGSIGCGHFPEGNWWTKFTIDLDHPLAWSTVQELGHVLNYLSLDDRIPTLFMPVSPPPYRNGGPKEFLSWVIECKDSSFTPADCAEWLEGRLPRPVNDPEQWKNDDD